MGRAWITGSTLGQSLERAYSTNFFRFMVFDDFTWDYRGANMEHIAKVLTTNSRSRSTR